MFAGGVGGLIFALELMPTGFVESTARLKRDQIPASVVYSRGRTSWRKAFNVGRDSLSGSDRYFRLRWCSRIESRFNATNQNPSFPSNRMTSTLEANKTTNMVQEIMVLEQRASARMRLSCQLITPNLLSVSLLSNDLR